MIPNPTKNKQLLGITFWLALFLVSGQLILALQKEMNYFHDILNIVGYLWIKSYFCK
jgi:hypothetical protein